MKKKKKDKTGPSCKKQKSEKHIAKSSPDLKSHIQRATPNVLCIEKVQNKESTTPSEDWFDGVEEETISCRSLHERVTEARKRQRSEAESHENSECEKSETKFNYSVLLVIKLAV